MSEGIRNAGRFMTEAGADGVKLEGGRSMVEVVRGIVGAGIPVMGHLGMTPQSASMIGGFKVQARSGKAAISLLEDALALEEAGAFAVLLELVPARVAAVIGEKLGVPTIGIGSGAQCSGQCQIFHDTIGMFGAFIPRHAKRYAEVGEAIGAAMERYVSEVRDGTFPGPEHSFKVPREALREFRAYARQR